MIPTPSYQFTTKVWTYFNGKSTYYLASVPAKTGAAIHTMRKGMPRRGWGSVPVIITIGDTSWKSSIFPEAKSFLFLINAKVRKAEGIEDTSKIRVTITLRD